MNPPMSLRAAQLVCALVFLCPNAGRVREANTANLRLARFSADVTVPLGHRLMAVLPTKAAKVADPLRAHGLVLLGAGEPIVLVAVDWCEIRNDAYDRWRDVLAKAAHTHRERVLVSSLHQHDAPVTDLGAEKRLAEAGLAGELMDVRFHEEAIARVAGALRESLAGARRVTHIGMGQAQVHEVASNRRVELAGGQITYDRGSNSGGNAAMIAAPEGLIDPWLKTISFWDADTPLAAMHAYATHPMSYYGQGEVSADFVGLARQRRQRDDPAVLQIYVSGCSGDVTAGKYNDGSPANRPVLTDRIYQAMKAAWESTKRLPLEQVALRSAPLRLDFREGQAFTSEALEKTLNDKNADIRERILAAMGLSTRQRLAEGHTIDLACIDLGAAQIVLFPGEAFVGYQLMAQRMRPDSFVLSIGYGQCWPGYIPTQEAFEDGFDNVWLWTARGAEARVQDGLRQVLDTHGRQSRATDAPEDF